MTESCVSDMRLEDTGFYYTMRLIQGKYKMFILYTLAELHTVRFNELQRRLGTISYNTTPR